VTRDLTSLPLGPDGDVVGAFDSAMRTAEPRWWLHALLLAATFATMTLIGGIWYGWLPDDVDRVVAALLQGRLSFAHSLQAIGFMATSPRFLLPAFQFSVPLLAILMAHEAGHYVAARRHRLSTSPPYFIPMPLPLPFSPGTFGAVIRVRQPLRHRHQLLDVGAWGPVAGFLVTVPVLVIGLAASTAVEVPTDTAGLYFGEPLLFLGLARGLFFPGLPEGWDIMLHPTAWAAWWGLFVTALNMLPFAQLDGGHVAYAMFGSRHRRWARPLLAGLAVLALFCPVWAVWTAILIVVGPNHPPVVDESAPLSARRRALGWAALAVFVLSFTFVPIRVV
jgi:membrane-associated protease RseP (regulator of RpoE activity)